MDFFATFQLKLFVFLHNPIFKKLHSTVLFIPLELPFRLISIVDEITLMYFAVSACVLYVNLSLSTMKSDVFVHMDWITAYKALPISTKKTVVTSFSGSH